MRVNSIAPGFFLTKTVREEMEVEPDLNTDLMKKLPQGRGGELHEIVGAAIYLASDASTHVTGAILPVDGGILAT